MRELHAGHLGEDEALLKYGLRLKSALREWVAAQQARGAAALAAQLRQARWQLGALHTLID